MIRVLLADDHPVYREGVRRVLEKAAEIQVVGETASGAEVPALAAKSQADVVMLDVTMPGPGYLETIRQLRESCPRARILIVSGHQETEYAVPALKAGAAGFFMKSLQPLELVEAVRRVHAGRRYVSADLADQLAAGLDRETGDMPPHHRLSSRELEVLMMMAKGRSLKEIAAQLDINAKTVSSYRARILEKLSLETNADLVKYAIAHDLVAG
jgi:DNA-binding NarL/FixJ family response regulator